MGCQPLPLSLGLSAPPRLGMAMLSLLLYEPLSPCLVGWLHSFPMFKDVALANLPSLFSLTCSFLDCPHHHQTQYGNSLL